MKLKTAIFFALAASFSHADVPHTFVSGQAAKASEVNENFSSLDTRITALSQTDDTGLTESVTYTYKNQPPGADVSYSAFGSTLTKKIYRFALRDDSTGKEYAIKLPMNDGQGVGGFTVEQGGGSFTQTFTIDGYPARLIYKEGNSCREVRRAASSASSSSGNWSFYLNRSCGVFVEIALGNAVVKIKDYLASVTNTISVPDNTYDFTTYMDYNKRSSVTETLSAIDQLVDYIKIDVLN